MRMIGSGVDSTELVANPVLVARSIWNLPQGGAAVNGKAALALNPQTMHPLASLPHEASFVIHTAPVTLEGNGVRLEPLTLGHAEALASAAADGKLWELWFTSVPGPGETETYITDALAGQKAGQMLPWVVRELSTDKIVGTTRYHDILPQADRVEIGYTWYAKSWQRSHVNTACKLLLLSHAFENLGCKVVGLRTDNFNFASQNAIAAIGAKKDGVIRHHWPRRDGTVRDTVIFSILASEWPDVKRHLLLRLARHS
jgi:RimJ/RimL family protein N-acetyltransferase